MAVRSAWRFAAGLFLSHGGAPWSSAVESPSSPSSQVRGSGEFVLPSPASVWRSIRSLMNKEEELVIRLAVKMAVRGVGSLEPASGDFPSAEGLRPIQAIKGCSGGGAPPAASGSSSTSGSSGLLCNFLLFLDLSVRTR